MSIGLDFSVGVRGRIVLDGTQTLADGTRMDYVPEATPGVVAGVTLFVRR